MSNSMASALKRCEQCIKQLRLAVAKVNDLNVDEVERGYNWDAFLQNNKNTYAAIVRAYSLFANGRGDYHRLKNFQKSDPVAAYLLHARNALEHAEKHGDTHPNQYQNDAVMIDGFATIENGARITMENCFIDGRPVRHLDMTLKNGVISGSMDELTLEHMPVRYRPTQMDLSDVKEQGGKIFKFPFENVAVGELPETWAAKCTLSTLEEHYSKLLALQKA